jgi:hypothetical protein
MTILNFVTQDELDSLDEDPRMAFMGLVNCAQRSLSSQIAKYNTDDENEWRQREEIQQRFMNVIVAAGKRYEIEPFVSTEIPRHADYRTSDYKQFESDLDHFVTQLVIDNSIRSRKNSVEILPNSKDKIRSYIHGLRKCVEDANITASKKRKLLDRLDQFEKELEKRRINILAVTMLSFEILAIPGATWASIDMTHKLITNITQEFAEAKDCEDQTRQIGPNVQAKALSPPRLSQKKPKSGEDLEDEIPF